MRNQEEAPYIVIERDKGGGVGAFVLGALVGAGIALLLAPKSGAETQEDIKRQARKLRTSAEERVREAQRQIEERLGEVREGVQSRVDGVKDAVTAGRSAEAATALQGGLSRWGPSRARGHRVRGRYG